MPRLRRPFLAVLGLAGTRLPLAAVGTPLRRHPASDLAAVAWGAILPLQSLPCLAALACAFIGRGGS